MVDQHEKERRIFCKGRKDSEKPGNFDISGLFSCKYGKNDLLTSSNRINRFHGSVRIDVRPVGHIKFSHQFG